MSGVNALAKRILRRLARPWLEAIAGKVVPLLGRGDLSPEGERIQFDLRVLASLRGLAQVGDHRVVLPHDSARAMRSTKEIRVGFFGNIANNAYNFTKCLRRLGYDAELVLEDGVFDAFLMNRPFWEDLEVECDTYEEGLTHEHRWIQPDFVRRVAFDPQMQSRFQGRLSAVPEVQALYKEAFGVDLPVDRALVLAQQMGHWAYLLAMKRYDVVQFSGAPICLGPFCPRPYVVFPTGSDLFIAPFEETMLGLLMRAGYRRAAHLLVCEPNYPYYLDRLDLLAPRSFTPLMVDTDTYAPGASDAVRTTWKQQVGGERFLLGVCRQSWEWKGNDRLIRGFAKFAKVEDHGQWRLVLIRWGPDAERTKALIAELGIADKVLWENVLSKPLLRQRQQAADLVADQFVMPGYGTSVLESLAAGKPVLMKGQAGHGISYLAEPPPFIPASELEEIAQGLAQATAGDFLIQRGKESRKWVQDCHGYKAVTDAYLAVYHSVLGYLPVNPPVLDNPAGSLMSGTPPHHLGLGTSSRQILNDLLQLHREFRQTMKDKFNRAVPLAEDLTDRWERARGRRGKAMKVFFMGATKFGHHCLQVVLKSGQTVVGCASTPDVFQISYAPSGVRNVNYADFAAIAKELGMPDIPYERGKGQTFIREVARLQPDLILVAGWYYMVSRDLRAVAPKGAVGLHGSLLPKYRGGAPLVWSIINGEKVGGVSLFYLEDGVDEGDIIGQEPFPIEETDTIADALLKLEEAAQRLLERMLPLLAQGRAPRILQNHSEATVFPQRSPADGEIDWSWSAKRIRDFIRAQTRPYPGAFTRLGGKKVILWEADVLEEEEATR